MFDHYVFTKDSCKNVVEDGKIVGFEAETLITYYRGVPLSMVFEASFEVDGLAVPHEVTMVSLDRNQWFTMQEAETVTHLKWEYGEQLYMRAMVPGGLRPGERDVTIRLKVWPAYYPMAAGGERTRKVTIN